MRIELTQAHEHAGRNYPAGSVIDLPEDAAEWLVAINAAVSLSAVSSQPPAKKAAQPHKTTES